MHNNSDSSIANNNNNNCQGVIPMQTKVLYFKMKYLWRSIQYESETSICIAFDDVRRCTSVLHPTYDHDNVKFMNMDFDSHAEQMSSCKSSVVSTYWVCCISVDSFFTCSFILYQEHIHVLRMWTPSPFFRFTLID